MAAGTSDPFSCSNLPGVDPAGSTNVSTITLIMAFNCLLLLELTVRYCLQGTLNGLAWEADMVLTELGNDGKRPSTWCVSIQLSA